MQADFLNLYKRSLAILVLFGSTALVACLVFYYYLGIQQGLIAAIPLLVACNMAPIAYLLAKRGNVTAAGIIVTFSVSLAYAGNELAWRGLIVYHIIGGLLIIIQAGKIVLPRKSIAWLFTGISYLALLYTINVWNPAFRYDATQSIPLNLYALGINIFLGTALFLQVITTLQRRTFRIQLITITVLLVLIPLIATGAVTNLISARNSQQQVINQLRSIAMLKEDQIHTWEGDIRTGLQNILASEEIDSSWQQLVQAEKYSSDPSYSILKSRFSKYLAQNTLFEEIFLLNDRGEVAISTNPEQEGQIKASRRYFNEGMKGYYLNPPYSSPSLGRMSMVAAIPMKDNTGKVGAILGGRINLKELNDLMLEREGLGVTGETYLVRQNHTFLTDSRFQGNVTRQTFAFSQGINDALEKGTNGSGVYTGYHGVAVVGVFRWLPELDTALLAEQEQEEVLQSTFFTLITSAGAIILALLVTIIAILFSAHRITKPLIEVAKTAEQIAAGDLDLTVKVKQEDEIGELAKSFNSMTSQLRSLISSLEKRVSERTKELERRSIQLQVAAEVARDTTSVRDLDELLNRAVYLIRDRYGFYHAGIFLTDDRQEYAILRAATGEAGRKMLEREHKLKVGEVGIVGFVTGSGQPRIAVDVGSDPNYYKNPLLPATRSEMALPLKVNNRVIGALDVQSTEAAAFHAEDTQVLQTMADQLAVAIENARLFEEMENALQQLQFTQGSYTEEAWSRLLHHKGQKIGYRNRGLGVELAGEQNPDALEALQQGTPVLNIAKLETTGKGSEAKKNLAVPIKMRDQVIGVINVGLDGDTPAAGARNTFEEISNRLSIALDNSRLLEETLLKSEQIHMLQEITATAASHVKLKELLDEIVIKVREGLKLSSCAVFLFDGEHNQAELVASDAIEPAANFSNPLDKRFSINSYEMLLEALKQQRTTVITQMQDNPNTGLYQNLVTGKDLRTLILTPLTSRGDLTGILTLESGDPDRSIDEDELKLIEQIGLQISVGIDVARLFEQTERKAARERMIADITSKVRSSTNIDVILKTSIQEI
ncbi:MAG: GAF domain-containing protein, partial [Omnitrophica WOR_2 bacterium]